MREAEAEAGLGVPFIPPIWLNEWRREHDARVAARNAAYAAQYARWWASLSRRQRTRVQLRKFGALVRHYTFQAREDTALRLAPWLRGRDD
jgi:hypothetical protein